MMVSVVPATEAHLRAIVPREVYVAGPHPVLEQPAFAFLFEGVPVAVIGGKVATPGVMTVWGVLSNDVRICSFAFHRAVKRMVKDTMVAYRLRRMQITVRCGYIAGWKWARALGFKCEGVMSKIEADGADAWLFARCA